MILLNGPYRLPPQVLFSSEHLAVSTVVVLKNVFLTAIFTKITRGRQGQCSSIPLTSQDVLCTLLLLWILLCKHDEAIPERRHGCPGVMDLHLPTVYNSI